MEPPMGQLSFFLLALQWARSQMENVQVKPFTERLVGGRVEKLIKMYPIYNEGIVADFAEVDVFGSSEDPNWSKGD